MEGEVAFAASTGFLCFQFTVHHSTGGNQCLILSDTSLKRRHASEAQVQVLGGVETSWK